MKDTGLLSLSTTTHHSPVCCAKRIWSHELVILLNNWQTDIRNIHCKTTCHFPIFYHSFLYSKCWRFFSFDPECAYLFLPFQNIIYILSTFILRCCRNSINESHKVKWTETSKLIIYLFCRIKIILVLLKH